MEKDHEIGRKVSINIGKANLFALAIMLVSAIVFLVPFFMIWSGRKPIGDLLGGTWHWGIFFIAAAAGDIWMTWLLTKEDRHSLVLDHPSEAGFYIIEEPGE